MPIEIIVTHKGDPAVTERLTRIVDMLHELLTKDTQLMATVQDVKDRIQSLQTAVAAEETVEQSLVTLLTGLTSTVGDLKKQLADALAANDPVAIQGVVDALDALQTSVTTDTATMTAAVTANTPAAP